MKHTALVVASLVLTACAKKAGAPGPAAPTTWQPTLARGLAPPEPVPVAPPAPARAPKVAPARAPRRVPAPTNENEVTITSKSRAAVEQYKRGRELVYNSRAAEGVEHFKKALELDPEFALALAYLGTFTPGIEGVKMVERAIELSAPLPGPERVLIEGQQATNDNQIERSRALLRQVAEAKPRDWWVQTLLASLDFDDERWQDCAVSAQKAIDASPRAAPAYNYLAYSLAWQERYDKAIAAASKQTELLPDEPNPYDTLGEILLAAGRLDEAQATLEKATARSAKFTAALVAMAGIRAFKGDWAGAHAALEKAERAAPRALDAIEVRSYEAWALAAQGKVVDMLRVHDAIEAKARAEKLHDAAAIAAVNRGLILALIGKTADAIAALNAADRHLDRAHLSPVALRTRALVGLQARLLAAWKTKNRADAEKLFAALAAEAMKVPLRRVEMSMLDWGQGVLALTRGDPASAVQAMKKCSELDTVCRFMLVSAQRAAGDGAAAARTLARLRASPRRDGAYLYFWATMR
jgi:tetratricopeptide (TPR) repeat protein